MEKPNVEYIEGLSPAISIDQKTTSKNPRSTVGTVTEIYDYLRLLFARVGTPHCPVCGVEITQQTVDQIVDKIMELEEKTKLQILAPVIRGKKGEHKKELERIKKDGFVRVRVDGELREIFEDINLEKNKKHTVEVVVDRLIIKEGIEKRLSDSIETALNLSEGLVIANIIDGEDLLFNTKFSCPEHGIGIEELEPRMFSFNSPFGACSDCKGIGYLQKVDPELVIPNDSLSIREGAVAPIANSGEGTYYQQMIESLAKAHDIDLDTPFKKLPKKFVKELLYGTGNKSY